MFKKRITLMLAVVLVLAFALVGCGSNDEDQADGTTAPAKEGAVTLNASGSSFIAPLFDKMFNSYKDNKVNYQSIGSGGGIKALIEGTVDFAATDAPMSDDEIKQAGGDVLHIPMTLGNVTVVYNLADVKTGLKLTPDVLAGIFMGDIKKWNDAKIADLNKDVKLPDQEIAVVHRSDGSGTTFIFSDYLSTVSSTWKDKIGTGKSLEWPVGIGAKGNEGVTGQVMNTPGAIGYTELAYAKQNDIPYAAIQNKDGEFVLPSVEGISAAAAGGLSSLPEDLRFSLVNQAGKDSYPIVGTTWVVVKKDIADAAKAKAVKDTLWWASHDGQQFAQELNYGPIPEGLQKKVEEKLNTMTSGGSALK